MSKSAAFFLVLLLTPMIAGVYGILHDQLTYTICPEYYTRFKFFQFGLATTGEEAQLAHPRVGVAVVGFLATWWTGIPIGLFAALAGLMHGDGKTMISIVMKSLLVTLAITFITGLVGLLYGIFVLERSGVDWNLPTHLRDQNGFIAVGSMHNFSYLGGLVGLVGGVIYQLFKKLRTSPREKKSTF